MIKQHPLAVGPFGVEVPVGFDGLAGSPRAENCGFPRAIDLGQSNFFSFQNKFELVLDWFQDRFRMGLDAIWTPKGAVEVVSE